MILQEVMKGVYKTVFSCALAMRNIPLHSAKVYGSPVDDDIVT